MLLKLFLKGFTRWIDDRVNRQSHFFKACKKELEHLDDHINFEETVSTLSREIPNNWVELFLLSVLLWFRQRSFPWPLEKPIEGVSLLDFTLSLHNLSQPQNERILTLLDNVFLRESENSSYEFMDEIGGIPGIFQLWGFSRTKGSIYEAPNLLFYPPTRQEMLRSFSSIPKATVLLHEAQEEERKLLGRKSRPLHAASVGVIAIDKHIHRDSQRQVWGAPELFKGPLAIKETRALEILNDFIQKVSWRNIHQFGAGFISFEIRRSEGMGMRWQLVSTDSGKKNEITSCLVENIEWEFRGILEIYQPNGHENRWRNC